LAAPWSVARQPAGRCTRDESRDPPVRSFPPGERRIVDVGGRSIGVFRVGESFYGIRNRCPHQGGPLCLGNLLGDAVAESPGSSVSITDPLRIACPWHGWEYDLDSGQSFMGTVAPGRS
jgi:nitrite reductase/ring-hydroxylating ferredoxin subunit